jgi:hypothetical protein
MSSGINIPLLIKITKNIGYSQKNEKYPTISSNFDKHFIRGYFDGNGSFGVINDNGRNRYFFDIDGSENILSKMQDILIELLDLTTTKRSIRAEREEGKVVTLRYSGEQALKIMNWIYSNATIKMERKYQKYLCVTH